MFRPTTAAVYVAAKLLAWVVAVWNNWPAADSQFSISTPHDALRL
jgi:hypothetical protein